MGFRFWGLGFGVGARVWGLGFGDMASGSGLQCTWLEKKNTYSEKALIQVDMLQREQLCGASSFLRQP